VAHAFSVERRRAYSELLPCVLPLRPDSRWGPRSISIRRDQPNSTNSSDKSQLTCQIRQSCSLQKHLNPPTACEWHSGGRRFDPDRLHQASFSTLGRERSLSRRSPQGEAGHPHRRQYPVENYARASQSSNTLGISPSVTRRLRRRCPAQISGWPYANHPPSSTPFGSGHNQEIIGSATGGILATFRITNA
jgi:hypothetical protein